MESTRNITHYSLLITGHAWRLSVLLLPWQIRWFAEGPMLSGYPWEQGRISFYLSWLPMLATIAFVLWSRRGNPSHHRITPSTPPLPKEGESKISPFWKGGLRGLALLIFSSLFSIYPRATFQFWIEVVILAGFVWALYELRVSARSLAVWFAISLIPHALLGIYQHLTQIVIGSKWLGIATQNPLTPGVSVIQSDGIRILRAYGGFSHPNIFGGWLAVAIPLVVFLAASTSKKVAAYAWRSIAAIFSAALILTFARGAWIACFVGLVLVGYFLARRSKTSLNQRNGAAALLVVALFTGITIFHEHHLVFSRVQAEGQLESKSLDERKEGLKNGIALFFQHPWFGVGPGATAYASQSQIIPHFVPLLILDEVGIIGALGLVCLGYIFFRRFCPRSLIQFTPLVTLVVLSLFDHYPWSLWSGRALTAIVFAFLIFSLFLGSEPAIEGA